MNTPTSICVSIASSCIKYTRRPLVISAIVVTVVVIQTLKSSASNWIYVDYRDAESTEVRGPTQVVPSIEIDIENLKAVQSTATAKYGQFKVPEKEFDDVTILPSIDAEIDSLNTTSVPFLKDYRNPCWYQRARHDYSYKMNRIIKMFQTYRHWSRSLDDRYRTMEGILNERRNDHTNDSWRVRCLPYFYIAGVTKCGTSDLSATLRTHPQIIPPVTKEPSYWNEVRYSDRFTEAFGKAPRPFTDYLDYYDPVSNDIRRRVDKSGLFMHSSITGDFTPSLFNFFPGWKNIPVNAEQQAPIRLVPDLIHHVTPQAKIVLIFRNPTARLYSEYMYYKRSQSKTHADFAARAQLGIERFSACLEEKSDRVCRYNKLREDVAPVNVVFGLYILHLEDWLQVFPREQIFITRLEDYAKDRAGVANQIINFLGLDSSPNSIRPLNGIRNQGRTGKKHPRDINITAKANLDSFYAPWNEKLANFLNDDRYLWKD